MEVWQLVARLGKGVFRRRKRLAALAFVLAALAFGTAAYYVSKEPPRFRTSATILLEVRPDRVPVFQEFSPQRPLPVQLAILRSRSLAEAVVDNLPKASLEDLIERPYYVDYTREVQNAYLRFRGLEPEVESPQRRALNELQQARVTFDSKGAGIVDIIAEASKPQVAVDIANTYIEVLLGRTRTFNVDDARVSREFLEQQLADVKRSLKASEEALRSFTAANGGIKIPTKSQATVGQLAQVENSLAEVETNRKMVQTRLSGLRDKLEVQRRTPAPTAPPPSRPTPLAVLQLREQLTQLEGALLDLKTRYTDAHPRVVAAKERIAEVQRQLGDSIKDTLPVSPASAAVPPVERVNFGEQIIALETQLYGVSAQEEALRKQGETLRQSLSGLSRSELEYSRLQREVDSNQNLHTLLADKLTAARIREQGEMRVVKVIDPAGAPKPAMSEKRLKFLGVALVIALLVGAGVPAGVEWIQKTVETEEDVYASTGLPVLALLPHVRTGHPVFATAADGDGKRVGENVVFTEAFRSLRVSIQLAVRTENLHTFVMISPFSGEGKSTVVVNLGFAFREAGIRVVIADTDLARPTLHEAMNVQPTGDLVKALRVGEGIDEVLTPVTDGLWLAGQTNSVEPGHRGMLATARVRHFVDTLAEKADVVLFDSSPVMLIQDSLFLAAAVDGVILVAKAGSTSGRDLARAKAMLEGVGARILGVVINQMPGAAMRNYYSGYYNAYVPRDGRSERRKRRRARAMATR